MLKKNKNKKKKEQEKPNGIENSRFEIEIEDPKAKRQTFLNGRDSNGLDALQRQRPTIKTAF